MRGEATDILQNSSAVRGRAFVRGMFPWHACVPVCTHESVSSRQVEGRNEYFLSERARANVDVRVGYNQFNDFRDKATCPDVY